FIYNTYITVGAIADGYKTEAYTQEYSIELLEEQEGIINNINEIIKDLLKDKMMKSPDDAAFTGDLVDILNGLVSQATYLKKYLEDESAENADKFEKQRNKNWSNIAKFMGIDEE